MTRVSFYLLPVAEAMARQRLACRLAETAYRHGHTVYLHTDGPDTARQLDELLWTFRPQSFVPHALLERPSAAPAPVALGWGEDPGPFHDVLVNLDLGIPDFFSRFERVIEVVSEDEAVKSAKRSSFRFYRDRGYPSEHHQVAASHAGG